MTGIDSGGPVIVSAAQESFPLALRQLRDEFGAGLRVERLGPGIGVVHASVSAIAAACRRRPIPFIKHLTVEVARLPGDATPAQVAAAAVAALQPGDGPSVAVQAWEREGSGALPYGPAEAATAIGAALRECGVTPARAGEDLVLSCCLTGSHILIGRNRATLSLTDWPGGRVRLARTPRQVSRAEFKLEELLRIGAVRLPERGHAVDLGAAPGGWTRILRQAGLTVDAVDPGELDPRVAADPGVRHLRTTAAEFLRSQSGGSAPTEPGRERYQVVVNDMRMEPVLSCEIMREAAARLDPGGIGVVTLKTGTRRVLEMLEQSLAILASSYQVDVVRQLQHNRHEVTAVLHRS